MIWVTVYRPLVSVFNQLPMSTQLGHPFIGMLMVAIAGDGEEMECPVVHLALTV